MHSTRPSLVQVAKTNTLDQAVVPEHTRKAGCSYRRMTHSFKLEFLFCCLFTFLKNKYLRSSLLAEGIGSGIVTAVAWVTAVVGVRALAQELPHAMGMAKKNLFLLWGCPSSSGAVLGAMLTICLFITSQGEGLS